MATSKSGLDEESQLTIKPTNVPFFLSVVVLEMVELIRSGGSRAEVAWFESLPLSDVLNRADFGSRLKMRRAENRQVEAR